MNELDKILEQLERRRSAIYTALNALRDIATPEPKARPGGPKSGQRKLSAAGRKALSDSMRKLWAAKRTAGQARKAARKRRSKPA